MRSLHVCFAGAALLAACSYPLKENALEQGPDDGSARGGGGGSATGGSGHEAGSAGEAGASGSGGQQAQAGSAAQGGTSGSAGSDECLCEPGETKPCICLEDLSPSIQICEDDCMRFSDCLCPGAPSSGGTGGSTGGATSASGCQPSGGLPEETGGTSPSTGGATSATGGTSETGGSPETGGSGETGGQPSGGTSATGGTPATGGQPSGGAFAAGGSQGAGGSSTGGSGATGDYVEVLYICLSPDAQVCDVVEVFHQAMDPDTDLILPRTDPYGPLTGVGATDILLTHAWGIARDGPTGQPLCERRDDNLLDCRVHVPAASEVIFSCHSYGGSCPASYVGPDGNTGMQAVRNADTLEVIPAEWEYWPELGGWVQRYTAPSS
jgi:hypothetical protein